MSYFKIIKNEAESQKYACIGLVPFYACFYLEEGDDAVLIDAGVRDADLLKLPDELLGKDQLLIGARRFRRRFVRLRVVCNVF